MPSFPYFARCSIIGDVRGDTQHNRATAAEYAVENEGQQDETERLPVAGG